MRHGRYKTTRKRRRNIQKGKTTGTIYNKKAIWIVRQMI